MLPHFLSEENHVGLMVYILAPRPSCCPGLKKISEEKFVCVGEVIQRHCLEESGQWLENVDQTHLVLVSG